MLAKFFRSVRSAFASSPSVPKTGHLRRYRPGFDRLEDRTVPALNLNVNQFGGLLLIEDSDLFDGATTNNSATITYNAGQVTVTGTGGTVVGGVANGSLSFFGIIDVVAEFGNGNDALTVTGVTLAGNVDVIGRNGDDVLTFGGTNTIGGRILFLGGDGDNDAFLRGNLTVFGAVEVINAAGSDREVRIADNAATDTAILGALFVHNGVFTGGADNDLRVGDGTGANVTIFGHVVYVEDAGTTAGADITFETNDNSFIGGDIFIRTGAGSDRVDIENFTIRGSVIVDSLAGGDSVDFNGSNLVFGHVVVRGGDGNNDFTIDGNLVVFGNIDIVNGVGAHTTVLGDSLTNQISVFGGVFIHNGPNTTLTANVTTVGVVGVGTQFLRVRGPFIHVDFGPHTANTNITFNGPVTVGGNVDLITGDGNDTITINAQTNIHANLFVLTHAGLDVVTQGPTAALTVIGNTTLLTGADADTALVNGTFRGAVFVDAGAGADTVHFGTNQAATLAVATTVRGPVVVIGGDGANTVRVNDTTFQSSVELIGGADVDLVLVERINSNAFTFFNGALLVFLGASNDLLDVGLNLDGNDGARVSGPVLLLDGGAGANDQLSIGAGVPLPGVGLTPGNTAVLSRPGNDISIGTNILIFNFEDFTTTV